MVLKIVVVCVVVVLGVGDVTPSLVNPVQDSNPREWPCPVDSDFYPCVCSTNEYFELFIDCSGVTTDKELEDAFSLVQFPFKHFKQFKIDHKGTPSQLTVIDGNTFADLTFEHVIISGTLLTQVADETFTNSQETLLTLDLSENKISQFPFEVIENYLVLTQLILDDNEFLELSPMTSASLQILSASGNENMALSSIDNLPKLKEIYFARIKLQNIEPNYFNALNFLTQLDLQQNELTDLNEFTIATPSKTLKTINLDSNLIETIHHDTFHGLVPYAEVSMRNNSIVDLTNTTWAHLFTQIVPNGILDLADNPLRCGCDIAWIMFSPSQVDLQIITDTSKCTSGEQLIYLDLAYFCDRCAHANPDVCV
nr:oplophorus-luciferin 2-monooxygenase non-catalytic subunit-like [Procambarus clarkii]XP_045608679.1 oplophorus-luciferin 2-monooxygenase non-catalytic subunit-like [Procambarus clarkii]